MTAWRHARGASLTAFALAAAACAGGATPASVGSPAERSEPVDLGPVARALPPAGPIVATVEGEAITLEEVRATAAATRLSPLAALRRLEEERVLYRHAVALGTLDGPEVEHETRRAAVQVLLRRRVDLLI